MKKIPPEIWAAPARDSKYTLPPEERTPYMHRPSVQKAGIRAAEKLVRSRPLEQAIRDAALKAMSVSDNSRRNLNWVVILDWVLEYTDTGSELAHN